MILPKRFVRFGERVQVMPQRLNAPLITVLEACGFIIVLVVLINQ